MAIYSSDLLRCRQTAEPIAARLGLMPFYDARLCEVDYGNWQGLTREEAAAWDSDAYAAFCRAPECVSIPGGESRELLTARVLAVVEEILQRHAGEHVVLVTHGGPIREILRHFDLWPGGKPPGNASRTVLLASHSGSPALVCYADVSHLPSDLQPDLNGTTFLA